MIANCQTQTDALPASGCNIRKVLDEHMESIWALSPQAADRLYTIALAVLCTGALLTLASLFALLSAIAGQSKYVKLQLALAEARTREAQASIEVAKAEQARLQAANAPAPAAVEQPPEPPPPAPRVLSPEQRATLARHLGERLPAMQYKLAIAAADDPEAHSFGLQLMEFFEDEGLALVAQRNPRAPYASRDGAAKGTEILVKYRTTTVPEFAGQVRDALAVAGFAAELRHDPNLNLEEVQIVVLAD
jgi:hypothetical protein